MQTHQDLEVIVVDDASTDDTESVVRSLDETRIRYLRHEVNRGPSASRNLGIKAAGGRYVAFLDSDDEWAPDKLERQLSVLRSDSSPGYAYCGWSWVRSDGSVRVSRVPDPVSGQIDGFPRWFHNIVPDVVVRRELAMDCLFDETIWAYENLEWLLRLDARASPAFVDDVLVRCYEHSGSRASDSRAKKLAGIEYVLDNYPAQIRAHPRVRFSLELRAGAMGLEERSSRAREHLSAAVRLRPFSYRAWVRLFKSYLRGRPPTGAE